MSDIDPTAAQEWLAEATEVLELVGDFPDTGSAEDQEFRKRAPYFMRGALDALEAVLELHQPVPYDECEHLAPCPTVQAIAEALTEGGHRALSGACACPE